MCPEELTFARAGCRHAQKHSEPEPWRAVVFQMDSVQLSTVFSCTPCSPFCQDSAGVFPCSSLIRVKMQCPLALLPLPPSVSAPSPGLGEAFSCISVLPEDAGFYPVPFCLPSALFLCPSATLSSAVVHLSRGVELLPTKRGGSAPSSSMLLSTTLVKPFGESVQENSFLLD